MKLKEYVMEMTYSPLGRCGAKVSTFSLGGWATFGDKVTEKKNSS